MADLLTELQQLGSSVAARRSVVAETDPLLLDEVYTTMRAPPSPVARAPGAVQQSSSSFTSGTTSQSLTSLAALAAYRRQLYLGLDPLSPAAAATPGAIRPASAAAAAPLQAALAGRRSFALKSRPNGMPSPDYGTSHAPGYLPRPESQDAAAAAAAASTPAQSGMGEVVPTRLHPRSCCPPPWPEPLSAAADANGPATIAARQAERELLEEQLVNRLVYDSLQPAAARPSGGQGVVCAGGGPGSCRSTSSCKSLSTGSASADPSSMQPSPDAGSIQQQQQEQQEQPPDGAAYAYAPGLPPWYAPEGPADTTLLFESRFESGNLRRAIQVTENEYDLVLQPDYNTRGHTQWFFFAVANTRAGRRYRFNIINLLKEDSLYNMGMLPLMHSKRQMADKGVGWVRAGSQVCYGANSIVCHKKQTYNTLTFTLEFPYDRDLVHLAHCYPLTWTDQQQHLHTLCKCPAPATVVQRAVLATSLAGNAVDVLTITAAADRGKSLSQRQGVVLSARVHPGETNSSWMMKGALHQLLADTQEAAQLREAFVFKVVPMLNPDGVIAGNYRCSLAGLDLNRVYQAPDSRLQPVICAFKDMVRVFTQEREVVLSCDMHGHSRRFGIFMYGCEKKPGKDTTPLGPGLPVPGSLGGSACVPARHQERIFPLMLALNVPDLFSYRACNFKVQKSKAGTGRVVGFRELGLVNAFTMEASFAGAAVGKHAKQHFNAAHLEEMGAAVVRTLLDYCAPPELNSAPELCSQLDAALLQGVTDGGSASHPNGSGGSGAASVGSAFEKLGLGDGGEEEDVCTDSDDESSDDDRPAAAAAAAARAAAANKPPAGSAEGSQSAAAGSSSGPSLADISRQLAELLGGGQAGGATEGSRASGLAAGAGGSAAAATAVKGLLEAIRATEGAAAGPAALGTTPGSSSSSVSERGKPSQQPPAAASSSSSSTAAAAGGAGAGSSRQAVAAPCQTVTVAAQQLLDKLEVAQAKAAVAAVAAVQPHIASNTSSSSSSTALAAAAGGAAVAVSAVVPAATVSKAATPAAPGPAASEALQPAPLPADVVAAAAAAGGVGGAAGAALSEEEAALLVLPGLRDILQQLVQQAGQHNSKAAAAATAKKKGRRKGRWGNPEVLRAARAKADAGLAAALPELGITAVDVDELEPSGGCWDDSRGGSYSNGSSTSSPATPTLPDSPLLPFAGRRAQTAGSRSSRGSSSLNVERYMYCLEVQKRAVGGVLASSSTEPVVVLGPGAAASASPTGGLQQQQLGGGGSPFGGSSVGKSVRRGGMAFTGPAAGEEQEADALQAAMGTTATGAVGGAGVSLPLRSKSAHPWLLPAEPLPPS